MVVLAAALKSLLVLASACGAGWMAWLIEPVAQYTQRQRYAAGWTSICLSFCWLSPVLFQKGDLQQVMFIFGILLLTASTAYLLVAFRWHAPYAYGDDEPRLLVVTVRSARVRKLKQLLRLNPR